MLTRVLPKSDQEAEATGELIGARTDKIAKSKPIPKVKTKICWRSAYPTRAKSRNGKRFKVSIKRSITKI